MANAVDERGVGATRLGSYEILRTIARGGMAEIFLARALGPEGFEKLVVLKKILPQFASNPRFVKLFLDEAKLAAGFDHPHIAHVYDMGLVDGNYFFTMEYVHGQDVRSVLRRTDRAGRQLPIDHAVQVARNVAAALHYAHERRRPDGTLLDVVHRDVSPSNIVVSYDGAVKLLDFGVAKAASSSVKTRTGTLKGKIAYMSPEQARGQSIDRRSDIFSLGIVLWELVATRRLYKAENDLATIQLIINTEPPPPSVVRPECPPELERIVMRALTADAGQRYQTAQELQVDLEELARENKLNQSSIALSTYMTEMFSTEIRAWREAQASGVTLTDHVVGASDADLTTPVSEVELSGSDEAPDDDPDDLPGVDTPRSAVIMPSRSPFAVSGHPEQGTGPVPASTAPMRKVATPVVPAIAEPSSFPPIQPEMSAAMTLRAPAASGSIAAQPRSRAPVIALAALAVIVVGVGVGLMIGGRGDDVPRVPAAPAAAPKLPAAGPTAPAPEPVVPAPAPAPAPAPEPAPEPAPAAVEDSPDPRPVAKAKSKPSRSKTKDRPARPSAPAKKPPAKFDPNAALPPE